MTDDRKREGARQFYQKWVGRGDEEQDARALYPDCSLTDLYDPLTMPPELRKAYQMNDKAVMEVYGLDVRATSEADCVAFLMRKYRELTAQGK